MKELQGTETDEDSDYDPGSGSSSTKPTTHGNNTRTQTHKKIAQQFYLQSFIFTKRNSTQINYRKIKIRRSSYDNFKLITIINEINEHTRQME